MRCLYCGKELALLKRWTGGGDFCSDAHKQSYQEEYNRLALSRLLQAQKKGQQTGNSAAQNGAPPPQAPAAVEEPVAEEVAFSTEEIAIPAAESPVFAVARTEELAEVAVDLVAVEESSTEQAVEAVPSVTAEPEAEPEPEPLEPAGFLLESPAIAALAEDSPYLEPWLELSTGPAMADWQHQNGTFSLSPADLVALELRPKAASIEHPAPSGDFSPLASASTQADFSFPPKTANDTKKPANINRLPAGVSIAIDVAARPVASEADARLVEAVGFESMVLFDSSQLLELLPTAIDFPAGDSDVVILARSPYNAVALDAVAPEEGQLEAAAEDNSPRASLEALSRLHQELVEQEAARVPEPAQIPEVVRVPEAQIPQVAQFEASPRVELPAQTLELLPLEVVNAVAVEVVGGPSALLDSQEILLEATETTPEEPKPGYTRELFEISIKTFPPAKPSLIGGDAHPSQVAPLLPHLKALPLRPKIALATGYVPPAQASAIGTSQNAALETKTADTKPTETKRVEPKQAETKATPPATAVRTPSPSKPAAAGKPATRLAQPKQPPQPVKPMQAAASKGAEQRTSEPVKVEPTKPEAAKPVVKTASQSAPAQEASAAKPNVPEVSLKSPAGEEEQASKPAPEQPVKQAAKQSSGPASGKQADQPKPKADQSKPPADQAKPKTDQARKDAVPNFGVAQSAKVPFAGSLKVKLGIAIVLLIAACTTYLGWGGKSRKPSSSNPAVSADGSGPSIIMGEGGWVEGWGGDPNGMHAGRQITIYRPSLNLSDYRLEFQGSIDTKSVGWVFRAADPGNYYAMKLMTVSAGLSPKVALFKYLVASGKQTQVGRVPIDLVVQPDTVFHIRVDVRGPQFSTFIQGQQVDVWTDDQLKTGGVGFLNEREERGKVKSVSIRYLSGGAK